MTNKLIEHLSSIVTPKRLETFNKVLQNRTKYITVLIEDVFQPHNASAVLRSCDCFGIQDVHIIENENEYLLNPEVDMGSSKWLNLTRHNEKENNTIDAINQLKKQGYRIVATTPHTNDVNLEEFDITKGKFALMFGGELRGLTDVALKHADEFMKIPMYGFTESFNISVSAAITFHHLRTKLENSNINFELTKTEKDEILLAWLKRSVKKSDLIVQKYLKQ